MLIARQIGIRLAIGLGTLLSASIAIFLGVSALSGDAATAVLGQQATPQLLARVRQEFGLDHSVIHRYLEWLSGLVHGDLGKTIPDGIPVAHTLSTPLTNTLVLTACTAVILIPLAVFLGVQSAWRRGSAVDHAISSSTLTFLAIPAFVTASLLTIVFSFGLGWPPPVSLIDPKQSIFSQFDLLVLPILTLVVVAVAQATRMIRASMTEVLEQPFIEMLVLHGVPTRRILWRHALPNAIAPTIQILALTMAWLVGGIVVVEVVFQYPGVGLALARGVQTRDLITVEAIAMIICGAYVVLNLIGDIIVISINPRLRRGVRS